MYQNSVNANYRTDLLSPRARIVARIWADICPQREDTSSNVDTQASEVGQACVQVSGSRTW